MIIKFVQKTFTSERMFGIIKQNIRSGGDDMAQQQELSILEFKNKYGSEKGLWCLSPTYELI